MQPNTHTKTITTSSTYAPSTSFTSTLLNTTTNRVESFEHDQVRQHSVAIRDLKTQLLAEQQALQQTVADRERTLEEIQVRCCDVS